MKLEKITFSKMIKILGNVYIDGKRTEIFKTTTGMEILILTEERAEFIIRIDFLDDEKEIGKCFNFFKRIN